MKLVPQSEFDLMVAAHSSHFSLAEAAPGVLSLGFGEEKIFLAEDAGRDFLYELTAYFAQKDLLDYEGEGELALAESRAALESLSALRRS